MDGLVHGMNKISLKWIGRRVTNSMWNTIVGQRKRVTCQSTALQLRNRPLKRVVSITLNYEDNMSAAYLTVITNLSVTVRV